MCVLSETQEILLFAAALFFAVMLLFIGEIWEKHGNIIKARIHNLFKRGRKEMNGATALLVVTFMILVIGILFNYAGNL